MSTGANLGYTEPIDGALPDGFDVANLSEGADRVAERADASHTAGRKLLVVVEDRDAAAAIAAAQRAGAEADVWAVARVDDAHEATRIAEAARVGGRGNVSCVRYGAAADATAGVDGWLGALSAS